MTQLALTFESGAPPKARRTAALRSFKPRNETAEEALAGEKKAQAQEAAILGAFQAFRGTYGGRMTPSQVAELFPAWPKTSIRRALSNLSKMRPGEPPPPLQKHSEDRRMGPLGSKECTWSLR